jgi:hypothetical protein
MCHRFFLRVQVRVIRSLDQVPVPVIRILHLVMGRSRVPGSMSLMDVDGISWAGVERAAVGQVQDKVEAVGKDLALEPPVRMKRATAMGEELVPELVAKDLALEPPVRMKRATAMGEELVPELEEQVLGVE